MPIFEAMPQTHRIARGRRARLRPRHARLSCCGRRHCRAAAATHAIAPKGRDQTVMALDDFGELGRLRCDIRRLRRLVTKLLYFRRRRVDGADDLSLLRRFAFDATRRRYKRTMSSPDAPTISLPPVSMAASIFSVTMSCASRRALLPPSISFAIRSPITRFASTASITASNVRRLLPNRFFMHRPVRCFLTKDCKRLSHFYAIYLPQHDTLLSAAAPRPRSFGRPPAILRRERLWLRPRALRRQTQLG